MKLRNDNVLRFCENQPSSGEKVKHVSYFCKSSGQQVEETNIYSQWIEIYKSMCYEIFYKLFKNVHSQVVNVKD